MNKSNELKSWSLILLAVAFGSAAYADETQNVSSAFAQARTLFQASKVPNYDYPLSVGKIWNCVGIGYDADSEIKSNRERIRFAAIGFGYTMLVNDVPDGNRFYVGSVWTDLGSGYQSMDSEGYSCEPGSFKSVNYYKRSIRVTADGQVVIERMTLQNGPCLGGSPIESNLVADDSKYPQSITDSSYRVRQYFVCQL